MGKCFSKVGENCGTYDGGGEDVCENLGKVEEVNCVWYTENEKCFNPECFSFDDEKKSFNSSKCEDIGEMNMRCDDVISNRGNCFYNGESLVNPYPRPCSDVVDITSCNELKSMGLCMYANKSVYPNLPGDASALSLCIWNVADRTCNVINTDLGEKGKNNPSENSSSIIIIVVVVVVVVFVILLTVIIVLVIIIYRRRAKLKLAGGYNTRDKKVIEMEGIDSSQSSSSLSKPQKKRTGFFLMSYELKMVSIIIWLCSFLVKGNVSNSEYFVGDVIGNYEIEGIIGRGMKRDSVFILYLFIYIIYV
jgi:hypothetical protein